MKAPREKAEKRVIHCHGCRKGVLVQYHSHCPRPGCGEANTTLQTIHENHCHACGEFVEEYTDSALEHMAAMDEPPKKYEAEVS